MADGSRHSLGFVAEVTDNTTPTSPVFQLLRNAGVTLALNKDSLMSEEIRSDRQKYDMRQGANKVTGDISVELSYGTFDALLEALLGGTWTGNVVKAGVTRRSFTFERNFADMATPYHRFTGVELDKLQLTVNANAIVKGQFSVLGRGASAPAGSILSGATYTSPSVTHVFDSFTGTITEGGSSIAVITEMQININNGLGARYVVGSKNSLTPSISWFDIAGTVTAYFEDTTMLTKFINETESSISFTLTDVSGNSLTFNLPRVKYTGAPPDVKGIGPITLAMPFQALLDTGSASNIVLTRAPAT